MAVRDDLIDEIGSIVATAAAIGYSTPSETNDIYENYVWAICIDAARRKGATISYKTTSGTKARNLLFRTSPGAIYSTSQNYTHAVIDFPQCPTLEAHVGIRITGKSRVLHECDVAIIYQDEAILCRNETVHPRSSQVLIAIECKFYTANLQLHLGRGFLGLTNDINKGNRYFVTNSKSDSVTKLMVHHQSEWETEVVPTSEEETQLRSSIGRVFRNFKARY